MSLRIKREQYGAFLSDLLPAKESENKPLQQDLDRVFVIVSVDDESTPTPGEAKPGATLSEQVRAYPILYFVGGESLYCAIKYYFQSSWRRCFIECKRGQAAGGST